MLRRLFAILALGAAAAVAALAWRPEVRAALARLAGQEDAPTAQQWPFDQGELRTLMDRVVAGQRDIVAQTESASERVRAEAFRRYYEGRRAAAIGG